MSGGAPARAALALGAAALAVLSVTALGWRPGTQTRDAAAAPGVAPTAAPVAAAARPPPVLRPELPPDFVSWLLQHSALRGSTLDGGWGTAAGGRLQPSRELRRLFDHLLQLEGQVPVDTIGAWLQQMARAELQPEVAAEVGRIWQAYLGLLAAPVRRPPRLDDPAAIAAALDERHRQRVQWLGPAWAHAFYGDEEAAIRQTLAGPVAADPPQLIDRSRLDAAALQRLVELDAEQARWQQRIADARADLERMRQAPELSALQRAEAAERLVSERFEAGGERLRARALLRLAP
ncbi:hypothetical protein CKO44_03815 [Rubrivivax gelatinosus]|uniref:lipase chaperone n=1 Tax=Rubrivivax gelatinosus TaxID=28068 RepID=UPI001904C865|nr:hypothetical protein [Rubrivivax gelatinosus]